MYGKSLYEFPGSTYKNSSYSETLEKGVAENALIAFSKKCNEVQMF